MCDFDSLGHFNSNPPGRLGEGRLVILHSSTGSAAQVTMPPLHDAHHWKAVISCPISPPCPLPHSVFLLSGLADTARRNSPPGCVSTTGEQPSTAPTGLPRPVQAT